jgi:hypothetical protein
LENSGSIVASQGWRTKFPKNFTTTTETKHNGNVTTTKSSSSQPNFIPAEISLRSIFSDLLRQPQFTQEDLAQLARSENPELRGGAAASLGDQTLLKNLALKDKDINVRIAATERITDQALLEKIARSYDDIHVRQAAVGKLSSAVLQTKLREEIKP